MYTSPQGEERTAINEAFDKFFEEVKELGLFHEDKSLSSLDDILADAEEKQPKQEANHNLSKNNLEL